MDGKGSFHPRRFIFPVTFGYSMATEGNYHVANLIICQDGPRVTITLPHALDLHNDGTVVNASILDKNLPASISPIPSMGKIYFPITWIVTPAGGQAIHDLIGEFIINPNGTVGFFYSGGLQDYVHVNPFSITYDTGAY